MVFFNHSLIDTHYDLYKTLTIGLYKDLETSLPSVIDIKVDKIFAISKVLAERFHNEYKEEINNRQLLLLEEDNNNNKEKKDFYASRNINLL